jgi:iron-sulfur cluster repair protein YtfE (RIC family)
VSGRPKSTIEIPPSIQTEHAAIQANLTEASKVQGQVGNAAKLLADDLRAHLNREEEMALPPLGVLANLANGVTVPDDQIAEAKTASSTLSKELPQLLGEHARLLREIEALRTAAKKDNLEKYELLADELTLHIQTEEEILYPAAVLVGEVIKGRQKAG